MHSVERWVAPVPELKELHGRDSEGFNIILGLVNLISG